jgi:septal ring factor EnvC (AmiA/AmiB activator)
LAFPAIIILELTRTKGANIMTRAHKALAILVVSSLGLWGCAKGPAGSSAQERIKTLESRVNKLQKDLGTAESTGEQLRKKLADTEERLAKLQKERDDLQTQLTERTKERDTVQGQFEQFRKGIRDLLGQAEATAAKFGAAPITAAAAATGPGKS